MKSFLVADTETILIDDVHKPYAAGLLMVRPGEDLSSKMNAIDTYFSEDYSIILDSFEERSTKVLFDLIERISTIAEQEESSLTVYFHNFSRFDGILLLKHLSCHHEGYTLKPLMRNHRLYELVVYRGEKKLFCFRDSLNLLPGTLANLAKNLCPDLGSKGSIPYEDVTLSNLVSMKTSLLDYMRQDILLLGGVMQKAQDLYWKAYKELRVKLQLALQDRRISMRLSGMKLPMLLMPLVLLNPLGLPLLNLTKQVPGEEVIKPVFKYFFEKPVFKSGLAQQRRRYIKVFQKMILSFKLMIVLEYDFLTGVDSVVEDSSKRKETEVVCRRVICCRRSRTLLRREHNSFVNHKCS